MGKNIAQLGESPPTIREALGLVPSTLLIWTWLFTLSVQGDRKIWHLSSSWAIHSRSAVPHDTPPPKRSKWRGGGGRKKKFKSRIKSSRNSGVLTCGFCCSFNVDKGNQLICTLCSLCLNIVENAALSFLICLQKWHTVCSTKRKRGWKEKKLQFAFQRALYSANAISS